MLATASSRRFIDALVNELSISDTRYEQANESYQSLGRWLNRPESAITQFAPAVYVQGSFGLGTVIKPLNLDEEYDIDAVCELKGLTKADLTQERLKILLGREIDAYRRSKGMVKPLREGRRCWTLNYADGAQFHMDIVPALPNDQYVRKMLEARSLDAQWSGTAIAITDNERLDYQTLTEDWPRSNPKGYLEWFKSRMIVMLNERKKRLAKSISASVEDIPDYRVQTPLQAAIMILKRHRDIMFQKDEINCSPISIIITTLAAHAYAGEEEIADALLSILSGMDRYIDRDRDNTAIIRNPSDPVENFADKWAEFPERERSFYQWLRQARDDFAKVAGMDSAQMIMETLSPHVGVELAKRAKDRSSGGLRSSMLRGAVAASAGAAAPSFAATPRVPSKPKGFA
ncbi:nucleotidyltransferase domain-containing protein [Sphingomonas jaspsi]|uniref:nucleotidyltransferase domain-containing protein n=1 Tax=Sphingomonas jaspsi TaxID=392409 RepID=UPI0004B7BBB4|nr:nucleotidyltransferase [Sphingomonas jaspsi]